MNREFNINRNKGKTFRDLKPEQDNVYLIDPESGVIVETRVKTFRVIRENSQQSVVEFEIYKITSFESITEDKLKEAEEETGISVSWKLRALGNLVFAPVNLPPGKGGVPTIISVDKPTLEAWMRKTGPDRNKVIY